MLAGLRAMDADHTWQLRSAIVLPDHLHVLAILGERLTLGQSVGRLKAKTKASLRATSATSIASPIASKRDFYDYCVRPDENRLALVPYIFLNPYRASLCATGDRWPCYHCRESDWSWFKDQLDAERPVPEWLLRG